MELKAQERRWQTNSDWNSRCVQPLLLSHVLLTNLKLQGSLVLCPGGRDGSTVDPWTKQPSAVPALCAVEDPCIIDGWPCSSQFLPSAVLHIRYSKSADSTNCRLCTVVFTIEKKSTYKWTDAAQTRIVQGSTVGRGKLRGVCGGSTDLKGRLPALSHPFPPTSHHPRLAGEMPGWALALQNIYKSKAALRTKSSTFSEFPENAHPVDQKIALLYMHCWDVCFAAFQRNFRESEAAFPVLSMQLWLLQISWTKVLI